jgi:hypothetical protein
VFGVVFLLVFVFSYSEEIVSGIFEAIGHEEHTLWRFAVFGLDVLILGAIGLLKRSIARSDGREPRLWRWWWVAVGIVLTGDVALLAAGEDASVWLDFAASTVFIVAMTMIMLSSLNADPLVLVSSAKRDAQPTDWLRARAVVPLIIGTFAAYVGATVWNDYFNVDVLRTLDDELAAEIEQLSMFEREGVLREVCDPAVDPAYFEQVAQIIPLLLITLGIEFGFFRNTLREPAQRAATAATVALMSIGLVFALSTLPWGGDECGEILEAWHEYLTFVVSLQAIFTGLATLVWLLVVTVPDEGDTKAES